MNLEHFLEFVRTFDPEPRVTKLKVTNNPQHTRWHGRRKPTLVEYINERGEAMAVLVIGEQHRVVMVDSHLPSEPVFTAYPDDEALEEDFRVACVENDRFAEMYYGESLTP